MNRQVERSFFRSSVTSFSAYWFKGVVEVLFFLSPCLVAFSFSSLNGGLWLWLLGLSVLYSIAATTTEGFPMWRNYARILFMLVTAGLYTIVTPVFLPNNSLSSIGILGILLTGIISLLTVWRGYAAARQGWGNSFALQHMLIGCSLHLVMQLLITFMPEQLGHYRQISIAVGIVCVVSMFFIINQRHIRAELVENAKTATSRAFIRQNRMLISALLGVVILFAFFRNIQQWVEEKVAGVMRWLLSLFNRPAGGDVETIPNASTQQMLPDLPEKEPVAWLQLLEQIFMYLIQGVIALLALAILFFAVRKLYYLCKKLLNRLLGRTETLPKQDDYEDEVEQLMNVDRFREQLQHRMKKLLTRQKKPAWSDFTSNQARVRYLYQQKLRHEQSKGFELQAYLTPRETLEKATELATPLHHQLVDSYENVRYGEREPDDSSTEQLRQLWLTEQNENGEKKK